jgi:hypothetical protein
MLRRPERWTPIGGLGLVARMRSRTTLMLSDHARMHRRAGVLSAGREGCDVGRRLVGWSADPSDHTGNDWQRR